MRVLLVRLLAIPLFSILSLNAFPETYGWPLQQNFGVSATFGEYRDDHFHAGIDLSTNGEVGLPVLAIADGQITRLKIQKRAYGKALYILHTNGITSLYAHLSTFSSTLGLEQLYRARVTETGNRYPGDIFLDHPIPVHKGDVVAFSGESGAGLPHLHLELRKNDSLAINPLTNGFQDSFDPVPPTFQAINLYPLDANSAVDGDLETEEIRLQKTDSYYIADRVPVLRGNFMASVSVYDSALRPYHRAPHKISLSIDNQIVYTIEFNELSYGQPSYFGLVYDLGKPGSSYYEYPIIMNRLASVAMPFLLSALPFYTSSLRPGTHTLQIEASDTNNNTSVAHIDFVVNHPPTLQVQSLGQVQTGYVANVQVSDSDWQGQAPGSVSADMEYSADEGKTFVPLSAASLQPSEQGVVRFQYRFVPQQTSGKQTPDLILKGRAFDGLEYSPYVLQTINVAGRPQETPQELQGKLRATTYSNAIKVVFDSNEMLTSPLPLKVGENLAVIPMQTLDLTSHQVVLPAPKTNGPLVLGVDGHQLSMPVNYVTRGSQATVSGENFELLFQPDTLLWDTFVWTKSMPAYRSRYLPLIGPMLQIGPRGLSFNKDATLIFHYPRDTRIPQKLSIYGWSRVRQKWINIPSKLDAYNATVQTNIKVFDLYALIYDNVPPVISPIFPKRRSVTRDQTPKFTAQIQDPGMDVNDEKVTFYIDGVSHAADYDPDRNLATLQMEQQLRKGYHKFWAVAYDYADNKTISPKITFRVR